MDKGSATKTAARDPLIGGALNAAIATAVVRVHSRYAGRGPTRAQAFHTRNLVALLLEDTMTQEERSLAAGGNKDTAWEMRRQLQSTMRASLIGAIEELTHCNVVAFMSDNHIGPDLAAQLFVLDRPVPSAGSGAP
jgi:uncharacterized protein YbcI